MSFQQLGVDRPLGERGGDRLLQRDYGNAVENEIRLRHQLLVVAID